MTVVIIGGGPAGLMAAEQVAQAGHKVMVADAMPSMARKFLMAGKSGLNLTKAEEPSAFLATFAEASAALQPMIAAFGPDTVMDWARGLGQPVFTGSTGRVFPTSMKASPLLRAWLRRLTSLDVAFQTRWKWTGWNDDHLRFETPDGPVVIPAEATVLALGGASWSRLGSNGAWADVLKARGVRVSEFQPANASIRVPWSSHMHTFFGRPIKSVALHAGALVSRGEATISASGLEGGGVYEISRAVRDGALLTLDLAPDLSAEQIAQRLAVARGKASMANHLRKRLNLGPVRTALLNEFGRPLPTDPGDLARRIKCLPVGHAGLGDIDGAISTAGGVRFSELDDNLMLHALPGTYCVGEMLDWEAPTGGYLLTACFATGFWAGRAIATRLA